MAGRSRQRVRTADRRWDLQRRRRSRAARGPRLQRLRHRLRHPLVRGAGRLRRRNVGRHQRGDHDAFSSSLRSGPESPATQAGRSSPAPRPSIWRSAPTAPLSPASTFDGTVLLNGSSTLTPPCSRPPTLRPTSRATSRPTWTKSHPRGPAAELTAVAVSDAAGVVAVATPSGYCAWQPGGDLQGFEPAGGTQAYGPIALDAAGTTVVAGSEWNGGGITEVMDFETSELRRRRDPRSRRRPSGSARTAPWSSVTTGARWRSRSPVLRGAAGRHRASHRRGGRGRRRRDH